MPADEIKAWLKQAPFRPFYVYVLESTRFLVRNPETCVVKVISLDLYENVPGANGVDLERTMTVALRHITRLVVVPPPVPQLDVAD